MLKRVGLTPDLLFLRTEREIAQRERTKVASACSVSTDAVFQVLTHSPMYHLFDDLNTQGVLQALLSRAGLPAQRQATLEPWHALLDKIKQAKETLRLGMIAKYVGSNDPYMSLVEALKAAGFASKRNVEIVTIDAESLTDQASCSAQLVGLDGIVLPGGFGNRGLEGKLAAARWAREQKVPYLGICLGMQVLLIEAARNLLQLPTANSMEFDATTTEPVISLIDEQQKVVRKGGTMRLGAYPCDVAEGTKARKAYGAERVLERHRHRFECNNEYVDRLASKGVKVAGRCPDNGLVEMVEYEDHPFMVGVQFHPEYLSSPLEPHPLIAAFVKECKK
jgi:CTP synthase